MIEVFDTLEEAELFINILAENSNRRNMFFKSELYRLPDGRWRVGIYHDGQLELDFGN